MVRRFYCGGSGVLAYIALACVVTLSWQSGTAQPLPHDYMQRGGKPAFTSTFPIPNGFINLESGKLHLEISLTSAPQRGDFSYEPKFIYDNSKMYYVDNANARWVLNEPWWRSDPMNAGSAGPAADIQSLCGVNPDRYSYTFYPYSYVEPDGTEHIFPVATGYNRDCPGGGTQGETGNGFATDASGYRIIVNSSFPYPGPPNDIKVYSSSGKLVYDRLGDRVVDTNGNFINNLRSLFHEDTLARVIDNGNGILNPTGGRTSYTASLTHFVPVCTAFADHDLEVCQPGDGFNVYSDIVLPDGRKYHFTYDEGTTPGHYGDLTSMTLPTGATVYFGYTTADSASVERSRWITSYTADGGTTYFTPASCGTGCQQMTVTKPTNDYTVYKFHIDGASTWTDQATDYSAGGATLRILENTYQAFPAIIDTATMPWHRFAFQLLTAATETLATPGGNVVKRTEYSYDQFTYTSAETGTQVWTGSLGKVLSKKEYDFGINGPGPLLRQTAFSYLDDANPAYKATSVNILNRVISAVVYDGSGARVAETDYEYDNYDPSSGGAALTTSGAVHHDGSFGTGYTLRGNVTAVRRWRNTDGAWIVTKYQYDDAGNVVKIIDPNGNPTTLSYADSWQNGACAPSGGNAAAYATSITNALSQVSGKKYYSCTGGLGSTTDPNQQTTSYSYDGRNLLTEIDFPDGGQKTYTYNLDLTAFPMVYVAEQTKLDSFGRTTTEWNGVDGMGRKSRWAKLNGETSPNIADMADTCYDALGRVSTQTYPYQGPGWSQAAICSANAGDSYSYDALGRVTTVTHPDGGTVTTDYSQFPTVKVTDEAGRARQNKTDALGRLLSVLEPDPATGTTFPYETDYQYDTLDNLLCVHQKGSDGLADKPCNDPSVPATWRPRAFSYDSLSRLLTATNPESGTITYGYDNAGNLTSKTSPAPNQTNPAATITYNFGYDAVNRLTWRWHQNSADVIERYFYDLNSVWGQTVNNPIGRLVLSQSDGTPNGSIRTIHSYDVMGRTAFEIQYPNRSNNAISKRFDYGYNYDGSLNNIGYPGDRAILYSYNQGQRPVSARGDGQAYLTSSAHYTAWGALSSVVDGNVTTTNYYNQRMQPCRITASTGTAPTSCTDAGHTGNVLDLTYAFTFPSGQYDNGNVYKITNNKNSARSQQFNYDYLNRLVAAWTPNSANWGTNYSYDIWGNLLQKSRATGWNDTDPQPGTNPMTVNLTNQVAAWCYDAAGNVIDPTQSCPTPPPSSYPNLYDGENRITRATVAGVGTTNYDYDADGRRVRKSGSTNTLYWHGPGGEVLEETDLTGAFQHDYVFFGGKRIARLDAEPNGGFGFVVSTQGLAGNVVVITVSTTDASRFAPGRTVLLFDLIAAYFLNYQTFTILSVDTSHPPNISFQVSFAHAPYDLTPEQQGEAVVNITSPPTYYYFSDHLGSADVITDANGAIKEESDYYPFGGERVVTDLMIGNNYKFTGKERDPETGCDYFGARYYCNTIGRFITPDWAAAPTAVPYANFGNPQSLNLYSYVQNNPTTFGDPDGHCWPLCDLIFPVANYAADHPKVAAALNKVSNGIDAIGNFLDKNAIYIGGAIYSASDAMQQGDDPEVAERDDELIMRQVQQARIAAETNEVKEYEVGTYGDLSSRSAKDGLSIDHIPSNASNVARATAAKDEALTAAEAAAVRNQGTAVAVPNDLHQSASPTYGGRNTQAQIKADAANPQAAAARDSQAMVNAASAANKKAAQAAADKICKAAAGTGCEH